MREKIQGTDTILKQDRNRAAVIGRTVAYMVLNTLFCKVITYIVDFSRCLSYVRFCIGNLNNIPFLTVPNGKARREIISCTQVSLYI